MSNAETIAKLQNEVALLNMAICRLLMSDDEVKMARAVARAKGIPVAPDLPVDELIAACEGYRQALDQAFAMLISCSGPRGWPMKEQFLPSQSAMWPAAVEGTRVLEEVIAKKKAPPPLAGEG